MRWIIKIILFPISLLLSILTAFLKFLLAIGTTILYLLILMCVVVGVVSLFQKDFFNRHRSIGIRILVKSIRNTDGWSSSYSFFTRYKRSDKINLKNFHKNGYQRR